MRPASAEMAAALLSMVTRVSLDVRASSRASEKLGNSTSAPVSACGFPSRDSSPLACAQTAHQCELQGGKNRRTILCRSHWTSGPCASCLRSWWSPPASPSAHASCGHARAAPVPGHRASLQDNMRTPAPPPRSCDKCVHDVARREHVVADCTCAAFAPGVLKAADWQGMGLGSKAHHVALCRRAGAGCRSVLHMRRGVLAHARKQGAVPVASQHVAQLHSTVST